MADHRTYRWLLISIAVVGLAVDQASKYGVFRWLYNNAAPRRGATACPTRSRARWCRGGSSSIAQFDPETPLCDCGFDDAADLERAGHAAGQPRRLFGMGGSKKGTANGFFAVISAVAATAILVWGLRRSTCARNG